MNLASFDLRLLLVFDAIMQERSVTSAGRRIGITQPATSNALNRLRQQLRDPLFIKVANRMEPTQRAQDLAGPIAQALRRLEVVLDPPKLPPGDTKWTFQMAISDHVSVVVLPHLAERMQQAAPGLDLRLKSKTMRTLPTMLDAGEVDLALGYNPGLPKRFQSQRLFNDHYVCLMRENHPLSRGRMTLERFATARHVLVRPEGEVGSLLDELLAKRKIKRRISMSVTQMLSAFFLVENSDFITAIFQSTADYCIARGDFRLVARALPIDPVPITMDWHIATANNPAHQWMRDQLQDICRSVRRHP